MPRVRVLWILLASAAACRGPPRVLDRSTPESAWATFRWAVHQGDRMGLEYETTTRNLRRRVGVRSRPEWKDLRSVILTGTHPLVRGIGRSRVERTTRLGPTRSALDLAFPLGYEGRVVMRRLVVLRGFIEGKEHPHIKQTLPDLDVEVDEEHGGLLIRIPPDLLAGVRDAMEAEGAPVRVEVAWEWFLDDFSAAGETPESVGKAWKETETEP